MNPSESVDMEVLESVRELMGEDFDDLVVSFLEDSEVLLEKITRAVEAADPAEMRSHAHALKSSSANLGAQPLSDLAATMEQLGYEGTIGDGAELIEKAKAEFAAAKRLMAAEIEV